MVKNTLPGQKLEVMIHKKRHGKAEGRVLQILESYEDEIASACPYFGICEGCNYQNLPYEKQVEMKEKQVLNLLHHVKGWREERNYRWEGLHKSPMQFGYRNKMEFTFGDEYKGGPLSLGLHKRGAFHDIVPVRGCRLVDEDFHEILDRTLTYFQRVGGSYFHRMKHTGFFRNLLVRKGIQTGDILVDLITTTPKNEEEKNKKKYG